MAEATKDMDEEERRKYQKELKKAKVDGVKRLEYASHSPDSPKIIIDLSYSGKMELIEKKSLAAQISHTVAALRKHENPFGIHVVNLQDEVTVDQMIKCGSNSWGIVLHTSPLKESYSTIESGP